jgi:hypothetical protein
MRCRVLSGLFSYHTATMNPGDNFLHPVGNSLGGSNLRWAEDAVVRPRPDIRISRHGRA